MILGSCHFGGLLAFVPRLVQAPWGSPDKGSVLATVVLLFAGHALCDFPLQGQFLSDAKNHRLNPHGWMRALFAHSMIHCAMVYLITGSMLFGFAELVIHAATDYAKCDDKISSRTDQAIHYVCKVLWGVL
jgi:hypothetical protein